MPEVIQEQDGLFSFDIKVNGNKVKDTVEVNEIQIQMEVNRISNAMVIIQDGGPIGAVNDPFENSEGNDFIPGNEIEISIGYLEKRKIGFKGIITSQRLVVKQGLSQIHITCKDKAVQMTTGRFNAVFKDKLDSDVFKSIGGKYNVKLSIDSTTAKQPILIQHNCSDWDFILIRAEVNNQMVITNNGELMIKKVDFSKSPQFEINAAQSIIDVDLDLNSESVLDSYSINAWDYKTQEGNKVELKMRDDLKQGNLALSKLSNAMNRGTKCFSSSTSLSTDEMKIWTESMVQKVVLSKIQGSIKIQGTTNFIPGDQVILSGLNKRFNGKAFIAKVEQDLSDGDWSTTLHLGHSYSFHSSRTDIEETKASGLIAPISGNQIAIVKQIVEDPDNGFRVLVTFPSFEGIDQNEGVWARMAHPYASSEAGFFFYPEIGDEVLLSFINNDPRFPVIVGSLYSAVNKPKEITDEENQFKSIYSKSGICIRFDDKDKIIKIETPGGNSFTLDDKESAIRVEDTTGNSCVLDASGITLESAKDMVISSKGKLAISAGGAISISSKQDVKVEGLNVQHTAKVGFVAKGSASAELSASGQTTVKGSIVMIN